MSQSWRSLFGVVRHLPLVLVPVVLVVLAGCGVFGGSDDDDEALSCEESLAVDDYVDRVLDKVCAKATACGMELLDEVWCVEPEDVASTDLEDCVFDRDLACACLDASFSCEGATGFEYVVLDPSCNDAFSCPGHR